MSLYELLNKTNTNNQKPSINLNKTLVTDKLQTHLVQNKIGSKPHSILNKPSIPLLLKPKNEEASQGDSRMVHRFDNNRDNTHIVNEPPKRPREPSH
jgi:hypothetical protein